jgi:cysteine desulfurase
MLPYFTEKYGNPSSTNHVFGQQASEAIRQAREQVATLIGAPPTSIIFTSGATESNNLALKGVLAASPPSRRHLITAATEHKAVLDPCFRLQRDGCDVTVLPVDGSGRVDPAAVAAAIKPETVLVSVMLANNEIGTIQPLREIAAVCHERGVLVHTDAAQAVGKIPVNVDDLDVDLLSLSAHKIYGPKGVGALFVRKRTPRIRLLPLLEGGGQENRLRSGTLPTPLIVGLGAACALAQAEMPTEAARTAELRDRLEAGLRERVPALLVNGHPTQRLPGNLNVSIPFVQGEALLLALKDVAVSSGSACTTQSAEPSHVLRAIGRDEELAYASLRFGIGRFNTQEEIDWVIDKVATETARLRRMSAAWTCSPAALQVQ